MTYELEDPEVENNRQFFRLYYDCLQNNDYLLTINEQIISMDYELDLKGFDVFTEEERLHLQSIPNGVDSVKRNLSFGSLGYGVEDIEGNPISVR